MFLVLPYATIPLKYGRFYDIMKVTDREVIPEGCN